METPNDKAMWDELTRIDDAARSNVGAEAVLPERMESSPEPCATYWIGFPGRERVFYREDVHALAICTAYRNGRAFERHAHRMNVAMAAAAGLLAGAAAVLAIFELVMR